MDNRTTSNHITSLQPGEVFVFGSNLKGFHAGGAARQAMQWGAVYGQGSGMQGDTYAIPTMFNTAEEIKPYVDEFIRYARKHPEKTFLVTEIGCGIAGFEPKDIAPLFREAMKVENIYLPHSFWKILKKEFHH